MTLFAATPGWTLEEIGLDTRTEPSAGSRLTAGRVLNFAPFCPFKQVAFNRGIGNVMMTASSNFNTPLVFAGLFLLAGLGILLYAAFSLIEGRVTGWANRKNDLIAT